MNINQKKQLKEKLKTIKNNELLLNIYTILQDDINFKPTLNNNGAFFNINIISDETLIKINKLLDLNTNKNINQKLTYKSYNNETEDEKLYKKLIQLNI